MRIGLMIVGALLLLVGLVWIGQGANLIAGSFMTGQTTWLVIGISLPCSAPASSGGRRPAIGAFRRSSSRA